MLLLLVVLGLITNASSMYAVEHLYPLGNKFKVSTDITIGSTLIENVILDTGSSTLWINEKLPGLGGLAGSTLTDDVFNGVYGDGTTAVGSVYINKISIGELRYDNFKFSIAKSSSSRLNGIIGLCSKITEGDSLLERLSNDNNLNKKLFTIYYNDNLQSKGEVIFGEVDEQLYNHDVPIKWIEKVDLNSYWSVIVNYNNEEIHGIIDTGSSFLIVPASHLQHVCNELGLTVTGIFCSEYLCETPSKETFNLNINNQNLTIDIRNNFGVPISNENNITCVPSIAGVGNEWIIGANVIRQYYTIWDFSDYSNRIGKVGFAKKINYNVIPELNITAPTPATDTGTGSVSTTAVTTGSVSTTAVTTAVTTGGARTTPTTSIVRTNMTMNNGNLIRPNFMFLGLIFFLAIL